MLEREAGTSDALVGEAGAAVEKIKGWKIRPLGALPQSSQRGRLSLNGKTD